MYIVWLKRDLRVQDHAAFAAVPNGAPVLPLYIVEPEYWALPDTSGRQYAFLRECLDGLGNDLAKLGAPLVVKTGDAVTVFEDLRKRLSVSHILAHEETGNAWTFARDRRVIAWAKSQGVMIDEFTGSGVVRRLKSRNGWAKMRDAHVFGPKIDTPSGLNGVAEPSDDIRQSPKDFCTERQVGGRTQALSLLGGFLTQRGRSYRSAMSSPLEGEWACSRLSPHFSFGTLSIREAAQATAARQSENLDPVWAKSLKSFQSRLAWRDHFMQKLEDEPSLEVRCLHSAYEDMRGDDQRLRTAWEAGETGLPFVDACMRSLRATGWLNFRMRSMLQAVASYHLWLDWRATGPHLARMFTDYEPGIHWSQAQMQSGTTGMNTVRIYNPIKQGYDQDPKGIFTRRWLPELQDVPDAFLQEPWLWDDAEKLAYPPPIVNVKEAAAKARERIWDVRKGGTFRAEAAAVVKKHGSRKDNNGRFVSDRAPRKPRKPSSPNQLSFDL